MPALLKHAPCAPEQRLLPPLSLPASGPGIGPLPDGSLGKAAGSRGRAAAAEARAARRRPDSSEASS